MHGEYMRRLVETELVNQIIPEDHIEDIDKFADHFLEYIECNQQIYTKRTQQKHQSDYKIHTGKLGILGRELEERGLIRQLDGSWFITDEYTGKAFMTYLAVVLGLKEGYIPSTDSLSGLGHLLPKEMQGKVRREIVKKHLHAQIINHIFPYPVDDDDPYKICRFKEKHQDKLSRFRRHIEKFVLELEKEPDYQHEYRLILFCGRDKRRD